MVSRRVDPTRFFAARAPTSSGKRFEERVGQLLSAQGLHCVGREVNVGANPYGGKHRIDWLVAAPGEQYWQVAVSCKWQEQRGTVEHGLDHEVLRLVCLLEDNPRIARTHLVIDGPGFSAGMRDYLTGRFLRLSPAAADVDIHFGLAELSETPLDLAPRPSRAQQGQTLTAPALA